MNYGIFVLGATIRISLFLRLCNCVVLAPSVSLITITSSNHSDAPSYPAIFTENLEGGFEEPGQIRPNKDDHGSEFVQNNPTPLHTSTPYNELRFCSSHLNPTKDDSSLSINNDSDFEDSNSTAPDGCYFVGSDGQFPKYLVCDNITTIPSSLPYELDLFELNSTQIQLIPTGSFSNNSISVLRLNSNPSLTWIQPGAFHGILDTNALEIRTSSSLKWIWFEDGFIGLNRTTILKIEMNEINLEPVGQLCREKENIEDISTVLPMLVVLSLRHNPLTIIPRTFFAPLRKSILNLLILQNCHLREIHPDALSFLPKLSQLDLSENPDLMPTLENVFAGLRNSSVTAINLSHNFLTKIPKEALALLGHSLQDLDISGNSLFSLKKDSFPPNLTQMKSINFESCNLLSIEEGVFDQMPDLEILMFKSNVLQTVPSAISKLYNLQVLDFSFNYERDPLGDQYVFQIPQNSLSNLTKLKTLLFTNTRIKSVSNHYFKGMVKLNMLLLENTGLESIDDNSFSELRSLQVLDLKYNPKLIGINANTFTGLGSLKTLYLNSTGLKYPKGATPEALALFQHTPNLVYLYLTDNQISSLTPELFYGLESLHYLDISQNRLSSWNVPVFDTNIVLQELRLERNNIKTMTNSMLIDFLDKRNTSSFSYKFIDLSLNPFDCDAGTCALRNGTEERIYRLKYWDMDDYYFCDLVDGSDHIQFPIQNLTTEICDVLFGEEDFTTIEVTPEPEITTEQPIPETTTIEPIEKTGDDDAGQGPLSSAGKVAVILGSIGIAVCLLSIFIYKNQHKFSYPWLLVKFHTTQLVSRKRESTKKNSELVESESSFYEWDVFVSYSHSNQDFIQESLIPELEDESSTSTKFRVCLHERDFEVGAPITENIIETVDRSRTIIIVMSAQYLSSQWCLFEMNLAYHRLVELKRSSNSFLLIFLEDIPKWKRPKVLDYLMKSRTYLKWPGIGNDEEVVLFWKRLKSALGVGAGEKDNHSTC